MYKQSKNYYRNYYLKKSIQHILINNTDVFDEAEEIVIYYRENNQPYTDLPGNVEVFDEYLKIKPHENSFIQLNNLIHWQFVDTVLIYRKPITNEVAKILEKPKQKLIADILETKARKKELDPEWEFIYNLQPDIFMSRKNNSIMVGSLANHTLVNIRWNMPDDSTKADLID